MLRPIGFVKSPFVDRISTPRQPAAARGVCGTIELLPGQNFEHALADLDAWDHIWVFFWFHLNYGLAPQGSAPAQHQATRRFCDAIAPSPQSARLVGSRARSRRRSHPARARHRPHRRYAGPRHQALRALHRRGPLGQHGLARDSRSRARSSPSCGARFAERAARGGSSTFGINLGRPGQPDPRASATSRTRTVASGAREHGSRLAVKDWRVDFTRRRNRPFTWPRSSPDTARASSRRSRARGVRSHRAFRRAHFGQAEGAVESDARASMLGWRRHVALHGCS